MCLVVVLGGTHIKHLKRVGVNSGTRAHANICFFLFFFSFQLPMFPTRSNFYFLRRGDGCLCSRANRGPCRSLGRHSDGRHVRPHLVQSPQRAQPGVERLRPLHQHDVWGATSRYVSLTVSWWMGCVKTTLLFDVDL